MPRGSPELTKVRRDEIICACAKLYQVMGFQEITIKEIAASTSFTRPSIYNYFQTKEEIFLALLRQEYERWTAELKQLQPSGRGDCRRELACCLADTLTRREPMLKLLSTHLYEIEQNSRLEHLVEFKRAYGASIQALRQGVERFCPEMRGERAEEFIWAFLPFVYGIYPYAALTEKQRQAMAQAGLDLQEHTIYQLAFLGTKKLLGVQDEQETEENRTEEAKR